MKTFLVGGAVRDKLLGLAIHERDWVVVGASSEDMTKAGFRPVGKDFPVFLHPETKEEYALARTERKQGHGYHGFVFNAHPDVTLEDDLIRRDLTINAMAEDDDGQIIDPYGGMADLKAKKLKHVSDAFAEDPLRVLRVARFAARFHHLGFSVAEETLALMTQLVNAGELDHLTAERVWKETSRALMEQHPSVFFKTLHACGALSVLFPELAALDGVPQPEQHHPEIDTLIHQYLVLDQCALLELPLPARFAALVHDLGKGTTPEAEWPRHIAHEYRSAKLAKVVAKRLRVPNECTNIGVLTAEYHTHCHRALELKPATIWKLLKVLNAQRKPEQLDWFLGACLADSRGRTGKENVEYPQADFLRQAHNAANKVDTKLIREQGHEGPELGQAIERARINAISEFKKQWIQTHH